VLVAPMVQGNRELIAGIVRDPQFGATVMLGVGGSSPRPWPTWCSVRSRSTP
jgi:acyl-CoA synthetase (NDP forming)